MYGDCPDHHYLSIWNSPEQSCEKACQNKKPEEELLKSVGILKRLVVI